MDGNFNEQNVNGQNNFGSFAQGNMMPPAMFGGQGGQFAQAQQPQQNQFK